ncbi:hypothetical protein [Mesorhizobium sp. B2-7-1]|uniref:hypothetical protein n=1 Tax=Mesorhizobium sp. B2-7-1 TaxID=2589909 RepID=UPI0032B19921
MSLLPVLAVVSQGLAEDILNLNLNLNQNQTGFSLPGVSLPQGQDEVHASDARPAARPFPAAAPISTLVSSAATTRAARPTATSPHTAAS